MDRFDIVAFTGFVGLVAASTVLEGIVVAAALGGFALSLSSWRLHAGRPWEAVAWLAWVGAAVVLVISPGETAFLLAFFGCLLVGLGLFFGSRLAVLPAVWRGEGDDTD